MLPSHNGESTGGVSQVFTRHALPLGGGAGPFDGIQIMKKSIYQQRIYLVVLLSMLIYAEIQASLIASPANVYIKKGRLISFTIATTHPWGITNEKGETALYSIIDSMFTSDSSIAKAIRQMNNSIEIEEVQNGYMLYFTNYIAPKRIPETPEPLVPYSISLLYRYDMFSRYELQYYGRLFGSQHIIHRFQCSIGVRQDEPLLSSVNFAFGIGCKYELDNIHFSFVTNYGLYGVVPYKGSKSEMSSVVSISPVIHYRIEQLRRIFLAVGVDVFLYRDRSDLPPKSTIVFLGVGIDLY